MDKGTETGKKYVMFEEKDSSQGAWSLDSRGEMDETKGLVGAALMSPPSELEMYPNAYKNFL